MSAKKLEFFSYECPHCAAVRNAADVAKELPAEVLVQRTRPLIGSCRRMRLAGPGRPRTSHCPGCAKEMPTEHLRGHRIPCVRAKLEKLTGMQIELEPKDPDPHPAFRLHRMGENEVEFQKISNHDIVTVDLRRIAEITIEDDTTCHIRLLGRVALLDNGKIWRFVPTAIGRPSLARVSSGSQVRPRPAKRDGSER